MADSISLYPTTPMDSIYADIAINAKRLIAFMLNGIGTYAEIGTFNIALICNATINQGGVHGTAWSSYIIYPNIAVGNNIAICVTGGSSSATYFVFTNASRLISNTNGATLTGTIAVLD